MFDVVFGQVLGAGSFGVVKQAYKIIRGKSRSEWPVYAIKQMDTKHRGLAKREEKVMMDMLSETKEKENGENLEDGGEADERRSRRSRTRRRKSPPHPGLIRLVSPVFESRRTVNLVMEYAAGGDLHERVVHSTKRFSTRAVKFLTLEILSGLRWIHERGYVFSDLKPENILIDATDRRLKLCDFGAARRADNTERGEAMEGTPMYMSPEMLKGDGMLTTVSS
jgi:serine/threonine protein kinase